MPHNHTTQAFYFEELSEKAQAKALDNLRSINVEFPDWDDCDIEEAKKNLTALGYTDIQIAYSGFNSQGDGASFTAKINICEWLRAHKLSNKYRALYQYAAAGNYVDFEVVRFSSHYVHEYTVCVEHDVEGNASNKVEVQAAALRLDIQLDVQRLSKKIYKDLESAYEGLTSDEMVKDTILANEYEFSESGALI